MKVTDTLNELLDLNRPTCPHTHVVIVADTDTGLRVTEHADNMADAIERAADIVTEEIGPGIALACKMISTPDMTPEAVAVMKSNLIEIAKEITPSKPCVCAYSDVLGIVVQIMPLSGAN